MDILYLHWWDFGTGVEEVMNSLHVEVMRGRVLYLGVSVCFDVSYFVTSWPRVLVLMFFGDVGHTSLGRCQSKPVRTRSRKDTFLHLSRKVERARAIVRTGYNSHGAI